MIFCRGINDRGTYSRFPSDFAAKEPVNRAGVS
jgi:hypothetical protein